MKVSINQNECIDCGACEQACSEVFIVQSGQKASIVTKYQITTPGIGEIPNNLISCAENAVEACPVQVITTG